MLFNSWPFLAFLPIVWAGHFFGPRLVRENRFGQVGWLTLASFVFYGWSEPWLILLLLASTLLNGLAAAALLRADLAPGRRRKILAAGVAGNLLGLAAFKYARLAAHLLLPNAWLATIDPWLASAPLPIGISFFTFHGISLLVDSSRASRERIPGLEPPTNRRELIWLHLKVWFYVSFFPQLVAGPILKARHFFAQIGPKRLEDIDWTDAVKKLALGFFFKMAVADNLKECTAWLSYPEFVGFSRLNLVAMLYAFSFQIYADFCGYSLIALGLGQLFGYRLPQNFDFPYLSRSFSEFWQRWHISLSTWLRDYLYIPLGGNRLGSARTYVNLFIVMFLGGLWHGAAWSYAIWGTAHGLLLAGERLLRGEARPGRLDARWTWLGVGQALVVFQCVSMLWLLFKLPELGQAAAYLRQLAHGGGAVQKQQLFITAIFSAPVVLHHFWGAGAGWRRGLRARLGTGWWHAGEALAYGTLIWLTVVNWGPPGSFIYFQF